MDDFSNREGFTELDVQGVPMENNAQHIRENNISFKNIFRNLVIILISIVIIIGIVDITISTYKIVKIIIPNIEIFLILLVIVFIMTTSRIKEN